MPLVDAVLLALVQGLTEFLPVSSSGHLALAGELLGERARPDGEAGVFYEVLLHVATMLAVVVYLRRELLGLRRVVARDSAGRAARRVVLLVGAASVPTAGVGLAIRHAAEAAFHVPALVGVGLLVTSALLASTVRRLRRSAASGRPAPVEAAGTEWYADLAGLRWRAAVIVGVAQGLAVWPGVSRSGSTIVAGLWMGVAPVTAARFSLLVSLPAISGAFLLKLGELEGVPSGVTSWAIGFAVALGVGYLAIGWLVSLARTDRLPWFALYTALLGGGALALDLMAR